MTEYELKLSGALLRCQNLIDRVVTELESPEAQDLQVPPPLDEIHKAHRSLTLNLKALECFRGAMDCQIGGSGVQIVSKPDNKGIIKFAQITFAIVLILSLATMLVVLLKG